MYILKWKDGANCEQQFEHQGTMLKRVAALLSIPPTDGKIEITERTITAEDGITIPLFDHLSENLSRALSEVMDSPQLTLADWLILEKRIEQMRGIIAVMKEEAGNNRNWATS